MFSARSWMRTTVLLVLGMLVAAPLKAQISVKAVPYSFRAALDETLPSHILPTTATPLPATPAYQYDELGFFVIPPARPGAEIAVDLGLENAGRWTTLPDGGRLWRLRIAAPDARALYLVYDDFFMPDGAQFFLYDDARRHVLGAFTAQNNKPHGGFATDLVPGSATTLEYYEPAGVTQPGRLHVATAIYADQRTNTAAQAHATAGGPYVPTSLPCSINVACSEGNGWTEEINSVVKISNGCTGVLLNNTDGDETPYVLTVNHCGSAAVGQIVNWVFSFNYQSDTCADPANTPTAQTISGAIVRATEGGGADFLLLELLSPIPASYNVHYAGWSIANPSSASSVVIGHPQQDIKKIAIDDHALSDYIAFPDYWQAIIDHGVLETGSSGSPLFNDSNQFVGLLRGMVDLDPDACSGVGGDDNRAYVFFPKLSYIWNRGPAGDRISDYLDPSGSGSTSVPPIPGSGAGAPSMLWINEINADAGANDEFIEVVGPPGTDLSGYTFEVYSCSGGSTSLQSTQTISSFTLQNDYDEFGVFVIGGSGVDAGVRDQTFSGGSNVLPDGSGLIVFQDASNNDVFDYQYDATSGGNPLNCPSSRTTRSNGDGSGSTTMGFVITNPSSEDPGFAGFSESPGAQNGGQNLPVELVSFEAVLDGPAVDLRWETASETNNAGFEIQSKTDADSDAWAVRGYVEGYGTTLEAQQYGYRVEALAAGRHRFRLKQIDFDGTFEYSPEVEVAVGLPTAFHLSRAYPNPFNPETQFSLSVAQTQHVEVAAYNMLGQRVATLFDGLLEAETTRALRFEARNLPSAIYLIRAHGERFVTSQTVTLVK